MTEKDKQPNCYECKYRKNIPGDAHIECTNITCKVEGNEVGIRRGWFHYPYNFDPVWLINCDGFENEIEEKPCD